MHFSDRIIADNFFERHKFFAAKLFYFLSNTLFRSQVETITLMYPGLPVLILLLVTLVLAVMLATPLVTSVIPIFIAAWIIGAIDGSMFTSFFFLAIAKTDLPCDMNLHFRERELVVMLLLMSNSLANFIA